MILEETINKIIRDVIDLILGVPGYMIRSKQIDAPRPIGSYGDVSFVTDTARGWEQRTYENNGGDEDLTETITGMREIMMSVGFYRDNAIDNARAIRTGFIRESVQAILRAGSLGLTSRSEVRDITLALENSWEQRAQIDITLSAVGTDTDIITSILAVDIGGEFQARGLTYNFTIEVQ